jgi:hypothetical protein
MESPPRQAPRYFVRISRRGPPAEAFGWEICREVDSVEIHRSTRLFATRIDALTDSVSTAAALSMAIIVEPHRIDGYSAEAGLRCTPWVRQKNSGQGCCRHQCPACPAGSSCGRHRAILGAGGAKPPVSRSAARARCRQACRRVVLLKQAAPRWRRRQAPH